LCNFSSLLDFPAVLADADVASYLPVFKEVCASQRGWMDGCISPGSND
jgi:hypothetical protein